MSIAAHAHLMGRILAGVVVVGARVLLDRCVPRGRSLSATWSRRHARWV